MSISGLIVRPRYHGARTAGGLRGSNQLSSNHSILILGLRKQSVSLECVKVMWTNFYCHTV